MRGLSFVTMIVVMVLLFPGATCGQEKKSSIKHLKKPNPNELYISLNVDPECPGVDLTEKYMGIVEGEFLRARIKRSLYWDYDEVVLFVRLSCGSTETTLSLYNIDVTFGTFREVISPADDEYPFIFVYFEGGDGVYGTVETVELERKLQTGLSESVYRLLTKFLKANFN